MSIFPGIQIKEDYDDIVSKILFKINSNQLSNIDSIQEWKKIDAQQLYEPSNFFMYDNWYLYYRHPIHRYLDKLFITKKNELVCFIEERIIPDRGEGIDIIISDLNFENVIICNHDGDVYLVN